MRGDKFYGGRKRNGGGGRGGRGRRSGGGRSFRGGDRRGGGGGRRRGRSADPRQSSVSGNQRERIAVESGQLVLIDQFMLANPAFVDRLIEMIEADPNEKTKLIQYFGGQVVDLTPGTYRIERDPFAQSIIIHPEDAELDSASLPERAKNSLGQVLIDTRCVAMIDRELLDDSNLLQKYQQLWFGGQDKACRDLLRDNGGAVRYGFHRQGDELGIFSVPDEDVVCLWSATAGEEGASESETAAPEAMV